MFEPDEKDRKLISKITNRKKEAESARTSAGLPSRWAECYHLVKNIYKPSEDDKRRYGKDISLPELAKIYRDVVTKLSAPYSLEKGQFLYATPLNRESVENASYMEKALREYSDIMKYGDRVQDYIMNGTAYGTAIRKPYWIKEREKVQVKDEFGNPVLDELGNPQEKEEVVTDHPAVEICSLEDIYVDPSADCFEAAAYVIHESWLRKDQITEKWGNLWNNKIIKLLDDENVKRKCLGASGNSDKNYRSNEPGSYNDTKQDTVLKYQVWEYWEAGNPGRVIVVINEVLKAYDAVNPYKFPGKKPRLPFFEWRYWRCPGEFYGESLFEHSKAIQELINVLINNLLDNFSITTRPPLTLEEGVIDPDERDMIKLDAGSVIELPREANLKPVQIPSMSGEIWNAISFSRQMIMAETGATDQMRGLPGDSNEKASVAMQRAQSAQGYFDRIFKGLLRAEKEFWDFVLDMAQKYMEKDVERVIEPENDKDEYDFETVRRSQLTGRFRVKLEVDPHGLLLNLLIQQLQQLYEKSAGRTDVDSQLILKQIARLQDIKEVDKIFMGPEQQLMKMVANELMKAKVPMLVDRFMRLAQGMEGQAPPMPPEGMPPGGMGQTPMNPDEMIPPGMGGGGNAADSVQDMARMAGRGLPGLMMQTPEVRG